MSKKGAAIVVWPVYIDSTKTRSEGRMVPKSLAIDTPTAEEIYEVCKELALNPVSEPAKKLPATWWERPGRVLIAKKGRKVEMLKAISRALQKKRAQRKH
jgi:signal recognition particle subunit SRP19